MEQIIEKLINQLTEQRKELVDKLSYLDENTINYSIKESNLKNLIYDIDSQISQHLHTLQNFKQN